MADAKDEGALPASAAVTPDAAAARGSASDFPPFPAANSSVTAMDCTDPALVAIDDAGADAGEESDATEPLARPAEGADTIGVVVEGMATGGSVDIGGVDADTESHSGEAISAASRIVDGAAPVAEIPPVASSSQSQSPSVSPVRTASQRSMTKKKAANEAASSFASATPVKKKPHPNQWTKKREAEAAAAAAAAAGGSKSSSGSRTGASSSNADPNKKKPHPNQWTYRPKDDPNRPKGANQYTVRKKLEALAAAAEDEAAAGGGTGEAAAAYAAALAVRSKTTLAKSNVVVAKRSELQEEVPALKASTSAKTSITAATKKKTTAGGSSSTAKGKEKDTGAAATSTTKEQQAAQTSSSTQTKKKTTQQKQDDDAKSTISEDDRIYCICQQLYDPERMMIACDRCDNWYHTDCVSIDDDDVEIVDQFICPPCVRESDRRTTWKPRCARPGCNSAAVPLSKYCSDWCGLSVAASRLEIADARVPAEAFWTRVAGARKREGRAFREGASIVADENDDEARQLLWSLRQDLEGIDRRRALLEGKMNMVLTRLEFLRFAVDRWEAMCIATARALAQQEADGGGDGAGGKGKTGKGKAGKVKRGGVGAGGTASAEAPCGFDVRLVWDDRDWEAWVTSDEGRLLLADGGVGFVGGAEELTRAAEEGVVCLMMKKRCDRHSGWQKTREADFEAEQAILTRRLDKLAAEKRRIRQQIEDHEEAAQFHAQGFHRPASGLVIIEPPTPAPKTSKSGSKPSKKGSKGRSKSGGTRTPTPVPPGISVGGNAVTDAAPSVEPHAELPTSVVDGVQPVTVNGELHEEIAMDIDEPPQPETASHAEPSAQVPPLVPVGESHA